MNINFNHIFITILNKDHKSKLHKREYKDLNVIPSNKETAPRYLVLDKVESKLKTDCFVRHIQLYSRNDFRQLKCKMIIENAGKSS